MSQAYDALNGRLLSSALDTLEAWLPRGRRQGREWCVAGLSGEPGQSLKINIDSGKWQDFATGDKGGDLISLYAAMHDIPQHEALEKLTGEGGTAVHAPRSNGQHPPNKRQKQEDDPLTLPPSSARVDREVFTHREHGEPTSTFLYRDAQGQLLFVVARYETPAGKTFCPWRWHEGRWRAKSPPKPRPLWGLPDLAAKDRRVVVVEGEKAAVALSTLVQRSPIVTWPGGANNWRYADWEPLRGRDVLLWPDADPPGVEAMQGVAARLIGLGCQVWRIDTEGLPDAFDAADLVDELKLSGGAVNDWLKPRMFHVEHKPATPPPKEPRRVQSPEESFNVPQGSLRSYQLSELGVKVNRNGFVNSMANTTHLIQVLIHRGDVSPLWYDTFRDRYLCSRGEWTEHDDMALLYEIQSAHNIHNLKFETLRQATNYIAYSNQRNCARDWLEGLTWDGTQRLEYLMSDGFGAEHTEYTQHVGRCFIMGMVARVSRPGCQLDNLPVFEGPQGARKSQAMRALGGEWHAEVHEDIRNKDFYLSLQGKLLVEIAEMQSFSRAEVTLVKAMVSRPSDRYRKPFGRTSEDYPRQCAFAATTNNYRWNIDPTGARRFWPIRCGDIDVNWIDVNRLQLFAEARDRLERGEKWWDVPDELARAEQRHRYNLDAMEGPLKKYLTTKTFVTLSQCLVEALELERHQRFDTLLTNRVIALLTRWGWTEGIDTDPNSGQVWQGFNAPKPKETG